MTTTAEASPAPVATPRGVAYADLSAAPPEIRATFEALPAKLNLFRMLANSRGTFLPLMSLVAAIFGRLELLPEHRELAVLLTGHRTRARYMWGQHLVIAPQVGVTPKQIEAIERGRIDDPAAFDEDERLVLRMADEILREAEISPATLRRAQERFTPGQLVELILVVGFYRMLGSLMRSTALDLDIQPSGSWTQRMGG